MSDQNAKKVAWENEQGEMELLTKEGVQKYFNQEFPDLKHAFLSEVRCVVCMDEGTAHKDVDGEAKFCMAGSGILFPATNEEERLKKVAELFTKLGIDTVTSHGGCGAAGLAYKRDFPNLKPEEVKAEDIENYAKDWIKKLSEEMTRMGDEPETEHITIDEMERPAEFHIARVAYYDAVGGFNPNKEVGLPKGFVIERKHELAEYSQEELKVAVNIAFGHHGFGELFSKENPFVIVVWANSDEELISLKSEVEKALAQSEPFKQGMVKIDGMVIA